MSLTPQCKATVEGILMALVSAIWLYGKQENLEAGLWYVAREVYNLCSLLVSSLQLSVSIGTRKDLVDTLESLLSQVTKQPKAKWTQVESPRKQTKSR